MSTVAFLGAVELGLIYGLVALGVFLSFRVLDLPRPHRRRQLPAGRRGGRDRDHRRDRTPGSRPALAVAAGALAGLVTAILNVRFKILHLLASILTMIALYSVNLRIMGRPNIALLNETTVLTPFEALGLPVRLRPAAAAPGGRGRRGGAAGPLPLQRGRPRHAGDRRQPAHGRGAGHPGGRGHLPRHGAEQRRSWRWPARCSRRPTASPT